MYQANSSARTGAALESLLERPAVRALLSALNADGEEARIIGGAVRDSLMGRPVGDIDMATTALPETVTSCVQQHGWKAVPTGIAHGTVTVVIEGTPFEVTTLRRDIATNGRHAIVAFTRDFSEDAQRRDFTINAMSLSADGRVHDYGTGRTDARLGLVRFMGEPRQRIREDYLRILRFFRFHASHGAGEPEPAGLAACCAEKAGIAQLSRERVRQEVMKLLMARGAFHVSTVMQHSGLWDIVLPDHPVRLETLSRLLELEAATKTGSSPLRRLAALLLPTEPGAKLGVAEQLRFSRREDAQWRKIEQFAGSFELNAPDPVVFGTAFIAAGGEGSMDALMVGLARGHASLETAQKWMDVACTILERKPVTPFRHVDFAALGIAAGPARGVVVERATRQWVHEGFPQQASRLTEILADAVAEALR